MGLITLITIAAVAIATVAITAIAVPSIVIIRIAAAVTFIITVLGLIFVYSVLIVTVIIMFFS